MYLKDEIDQLMAAVTQEQMDAVEAASEEELDSISLEYGIVDRPLPEHHRRLWVVYESGMRAAQAVLERLQEDAEDLDRDEMNARVLEMGVLKKKLDLVGEMFWEDVNREFPELRSRDSLSLIDGWRIAWSVRHPCLGCPIRTECDDRYGKATPKEERHARMDEDGWNPQAAFARVMMSQMLGLDPEDMDDMGIEVMMVDGDGIPDPDIEFDTSDFSDGALDDDIDSGAGDDSGPVVEDDDPPDGD